MIISKAKLNALGLASAFFVISFRLPCVKGAVVIFDD